MEKLKGITLQAHDQATGEVERIAWDPNDVHTATHTLENTLAFLTTLGNRQDISDNDILVIHEQRRALIEAIPKLQTIERNSQILFTILPKLLGKRHSNDGLEPDDHLLTHMLQSIVENRFGGHVIMTNSEMVAARCDDVTAKPFFIDDRGAPSLVIYNPSIHSEDEAVKWAKSILAPIPSVTSAI